jgi:hypothetical protein
MLTALLVSMFAVMMVPACQAEDFTLLCRPYFGDACSEAIGHWLPRVYDNGLKGDAYKDVTMTHVHDEIVDPADTGPPTHLGQREVFGGTLFVYGLAGPPKGRLVYDPAHHIAYFDEGCCSWHHVVIAADAAPPPKVVAERSLSGLHTMRGLRLGDSPAAVRAVFGSAPLHATSISGQTDLLYQRLLVEPKPYSSCFENDTFLFRRGKLAAMEFLASC